MANIDRIVKINIALRTAGAQQQSFSDIILIGQTTMPERVRIIRSADELLTDATFGVTAASPLYRAAQAGFSQIPAPSRMFIGRRDGNENLEAALASIRAANDGWYAMSDVTRAPADVMGFAQWAEANKKLNLTAFNVADIAPNGPAAGLMTGNMFRTAWWLVQDKANHFVDVATAVRAFSTLPGGETWANLRLAGVPSFAMTETQYNSATALNGNTFEPFRNLSITQNGRVAGGEWIDVIRFRDWLEEECSVRVFNLLVDNRIPYTDVGIGMVVQQIRSALDLGVTRGGIAPDELMPDGRSINPSYVLRFPRASAVSSADKNARLLRDVGFTARLAGAIHAVTVNGTLTYDNIA